ncbi:MAG: PIG-L family deacetylase [Planctomycetes bacterium]|nr:PIG-L family deacetylase [Planctomycetota bacterium]
MIDLGFRFPALLPWRALVGARVLVVAPHADDEVISAGGLLAQAAANGVAVRVLHLTDGSAGDPTGSYGDIVAVRRAESDAALAALGLEPALEFGFGDGTLGARVGELAERLQAELRSFEPDTAIALSPFEAHADHRAAAEALRRALPASPAVRRVLWAGVNSPVPANLLVDITTALAQKDAAMACYASQIATNDIRTKVRALDASRTVNVDLPEVRACEAFLRLDAGRSDELFALVERLERLTFEDACS